MILQFFISSCVLITAISVLCIFFKDKILIIESSATMKQKLFIGAAGGLMEVLLMVFPIYIMSDLSVNFHALPIILVSFYGGSISAITTAVIVNSLGYLLFKMPIVSIAFAISDLFLVIGIIFILNTKTTRKNKWIYSVLYSLIINSIVHGIFIKDLKILAGLMIVYSINNILLAYFIFNFTEYLKRTFEVYQKLKNEATIDFLTGLNNVRQFNKNLSSIINAVRTKTEGEYISLIFLDIDYFKNINDEYGHGSGDIILKEFADILKNTCRAFDIISRNGGEEFSVILLNCPSINAIQVAEKVRKNVEEHKFYISENVSISVTISAGVSTYPNITSNMDSLVKDADTALYEAKNTGRNKVILYNNKI